MKERIEEILAQFKGTLTGEGRDIRLLDIAADGVVRVEITGISDSCPMLQFMLKYYMNRILKKYVPGVKDTVYTVKSLPGETSGRRFYCPAAPDNAPGALGDPRNKQAQRENLSA
jgi:Fe-S cluster biogenesis protein NfuA